MLLKNVTYISTRTFLTKMITFCKYWLLYLKIFLQISISFFKVFSLYHHNVQFKILDCNISNSYYSLPISQTFVSWQLNLFFENLNRFLKTLAIFAVLVLHMKILAYLRKIFIIKPESWWFLFCLKILAACQKLDQNF